MKQFIIKLGHFFFKRRSYASLPIFAFFLFFGQTSYVSFVLALCLIAFGEFIRIWAVSFSGPATRTRTIKAPFLATDGPYQIIRHPIYFGNFFVGLGFTLSLTYNLSHILIFLVFFFIFYGAIIFAEEDFLENKFQDEWRNYKQKVPLIVPKKLRKVSFGDLNMSLKSEKSTFITISIVLILSSIKVFISPSVSISF